MSRKEPLSVEALLQKQKEDAAVKVRAPLLSPCSIASLTGSAPLLLQPKFLSKAERQALALEKRQKEIAEKTAKDEAERKKREEFERTAQSQHHPGERSNAYAGSSGRHDPRMAQATYANAPSGPRAERGGRNWVNGNANGNGYVDRDTPSASSSRLHQNGHQNSHGNQPPTGPRSNGAAAPYGYRTASNASQHPNGNVSSSSAATFDPSSLSSEKPLTPAEQELVRKKYLGIKSASTKKTRRMLQDKKFMFAHDMNEDTTDNINPVFQHVIQPKAFGVGLKADGAGSASPVNGSSHSAGPNGGEHVAADGLERRRGARNAMDEKHWTEKPLEEMKERDWRIFREDFAISARGGHIPKPLRSWQESKIPKPILEAIEIIGYKDPSPIQRQAIPIGLENRDLIGIAETGSGKTASFVIPMLAYILDLPRLSDENRHLGPYALILAPTRELAQQIEGEAQKFASHLGFTCVSIVGGRDVQEQAYNMRNGAEIVIATPGRLKDCIERHILVLSQCTYVVMDEADRMLNLGFEAELTAILDALPVTNLKPDTEDAEDPLRLLRAEDDTRIDKYRVTMLYSATMPPAVERMSKKYLRRPASITIGDANQAVGTVEQRVEFVQSDEKKRSRLLQILNQGVGGPAIIFCSTIIDADGLGKYLMSAGWNPAVLHSRKTQSQREEALASLRSGECPVLVATDLAGRGIDVANVALVVNFQMANNIESYIHRIGRTGRAGNRGVAITFLDSGDDDILYDLKQEISRSPVSKLPLDLAKHPAAQSRVTREMKRKRAQEEEG